MDNIPEERMSPMPVSYMKFVPIVSDLRTTIHDAYIENGTDGRTLVLVLKNGSLMRVRITEAALHNLFSHRL